MSSSFILSPVRFEISESFLHSLLLPAKPLRMKIRTRSFVGNMLQNVSWSRVGSSWEASFVQEEGRKSFHAFHLLSNTQSLYSCLYTDCDIENVYEAEQQNLNAEHYLQDNHNFLKVDSASKVWLDNGIEVDFDLGEGYNFQLIFPLREKDQRLLGVDGIGYVLRKNVYHMIVGIPTSSIQKCREHQESTLCIKLGRGVTRYETSMSLDSLKVKSKDEQITYFDIKLPSSSLLAMRQEPLSVEARIGNQSSKIFLYQSADFRPYALRYLILEKSNKESGNRIFNMAWYWPALVLNEVQRTQPSNQSSSEQGLSKDTAFMRFNASVQVGDKDRDATLSVAKNIVKAVDGFEELKNAGVLLVFPGKKPLLLRDSRNTQRWKDWSAHHSKLDTYVVVTFSPEHLSPSMLSQSEEHWSQEWEGKVWLGGLPLKESLFSFPDGKFLPWLDTTVNTNHIEVCLDFLNVQNAQGLGYLAGRGRTKISVKELLSDLFDKDTDLYDLERWLNVGASHKIKERLSEENDRFQWGEESLEIVCRAIRKLAELLKDTEFSYVAMEQGIEKGNLVDLTKRRIQVDDLHLGFGRVMSRVRGDVFVPLYKKNSLTSKLLALRNDCSVALESLPVRWERKEQATILSWLVKNVRVHLVQEPLDGIATSKLSLQPKEVDEWAFYARVLSQSGKSIPGLPCVLYHSSSGLERRVSTDESGVLHVRGIEKGKYQVRLPPSKHEVKQGDCFSSLAQSYGFEDANSLYNLQSESFRNQRPNLNLLVVGDKIHIPGREVTGDFSTGRTDNLVRLPGSLVKLQLRLNDEDGEPLKNWRYRLWLDGEEWKPKVEKKTGEDGQVTEDVPADVFEGILNVWKSEHSSQRHYSIHLLLGNLDPADTVSGVQARLNNLGFDCGNVDGINGPRTQASIRTFQRFFGLEIDGIVGSATRCKLIEEYGC